MAFRLNKKERQLVTIGLVLLFGAIAYWAYQGGNFGFIDLSGWLHSNEASGTGGETYELGVINLTSQVLETGDLKVSFELANEDKFNITSVKVYYALNVADPSNATYTAVTASKATNSTVYEATIDSSFGDTVYYYIEVQYVQDGSTLVFRYPSSGYQSVAVSDTFDPAINNVTVDYNATTGNATFTIDASDNDALDKVILYYYISLDGNETGATFTSVNLTTSPYTYTLTVDSSVSDTTYYYVDFYVKVIDLSGNTVRLPASGTFEFYANETASLVFPQSG